MIGPGAKIVVRYADGKLVKGYTFDFAPGRRCFHVFTARDASSDPIPIQLSELKAVFLVREFAGNAQYSERKSFADGARPPGRRIEITFKDGEVLVGSTRDAIESRPGLWFTPADPVSNNLGVYAVSEAVRRIRPLPAEEPTRTPAGSPRHEAALPSGLLAWLRQPVLQLQAR
jgi:hypothetical protein